MTTSDRGGNAPGELLAVRPGATLGRFTLAGLLGQGGMAAVYRAHDPTLGRDVAIKVLAPALAARGDAEERFRREARAVAALHHPHVIRVHDFVPAGDLSPAYLVEELIEGPTLTALLAERGGKLLPEAAIAIGAVVADALAAAHARGVVHRDVKPENVMIDRAAGGARVVLTDFGVARVAGLDTMTATGAVVGSPSYMAPEQARGHDVDERTDVWGVGVMLYQLATGKLPFAGRDPLVVLGAIMRGTFERPSRYDARVGIALEALIVRCLRPTPTERPGAAALRDELRALAAEAGDVAADPGFLARWLDDAETTEAALAPRVAEAACARAREHLRTRATARAIAEIGRATAYVPNHADAAKLLASLERRGRVRRSVKAGSIVIALAVTVAAGVSIAGRIRARAPVVAAPPAAPAPLVSPPPAAPPAPPPAVEPVAAAPARPARPPATRRRVVAATTSVVAPPPPAPAVTIPEPTAPPPKPTRAAPAPPAPATVTLTAQFAICYPTLDDRPATDRKPVFRDVAPGRHVVRCADQAGGPARDVGPIDVAPGAQMSKVVVRDATTGALSLSSRR